MVVNFKNKESGVILITVVIFVMILSLLAASVLYVMTNDARITDINIKRIQANYAAQAGIQYLIDCNSKPILCTSPITIGSYSVNVTSYSTPFPAGCPTGGATSQCLEATVSY
ncbi:MAG: pilus assembly PilX N-terminal domain-containing protein [Candidatus Omnitrophica bacterium]|nr:pilus assembly PilX N-terminal domain-containing protein [Candidatus Omnitrophota bacterium]HOX54959.1 pilus assembly PilX N-terminal domain-containing protein [Candidatus Omnitrophota bacterium]